MKTIRFIAGILGFLLVGVLVLGGVSLLSGPLALAGIVMMGVALLLMGPVGVLLFCVFEVVEEAAKELFSILLDLPFFLRSFFWSVPLFFVRIVIWVVERWKGVRR
jgi:hypothetical protein